MSSLAQEKSAAKPRVPRLGFLGVGWIGRNRMEALAGLGKIEIAAIADPRLEEMPADTLPAGAARCPHLEALFEQNLDGVVIATPSALHAAQSIAALQAGLAVFCQKPLGRTAAEVRQVIAAARQADRLLAVDLSYRHLAGMRQIRQLIQAGEIGKIFAVDLIFHNACGPDKAWYYEASQSGGGCVMDLGVHLVDLVLWALGYPRVAHVSSRIFAKGSCLRPPITEVEDYAAARIEFEDGAMANLACSWRLPAGRDAIIEASFYGTRGGLSLTNINGSFSDFQAYHYQGTSKIMLNDGPEKWQAGAVAEWANLLAVNPHFNPSIEALVPVAEILDAIYYRP